MIAAELLTGAMLGWLARLPVLALSMAGALVSTMVGLSSVLQPDPALGGQSSALARLFGLLAPVLCCRQGCTRCRSQALAGSYDLIAPGAVLPPGAMVETVQQAASASLGLGAPARGAVRAGGPGRAGKRSGLLARLVPQLQVFTAAAPGQILGGLAWSACSPPRSPRPGCSRWRQLGPVLPRPLSGCAEAEDRTQAPSERRRQRARDEGQAPLSRELVVAAACWALRPSCWPWRTRVDRRASRCGCATCWPTSGRRRTPPVRQGAVALAGRAVPLAGAVLLAGSAAVLLQTGFLVHGKALLPDPARLDPRRGLKRVFGLDER